MDQQSLRREFMSFSREMQNFVQVTLVPICQNHDITLQQLYVLTELKAEPRQTISQLSDRIGILRTNFPQICRKLEDRGLIERKQSTVDKRASIIEMTDAGHQLLNAVDDEMTLKFGGRLDSEPEETFDAIFLGLEALRSLTGKLMVVR